MTEGHSTDRSGGLGMPQVLRFKTGAGVMMVGALFMLVGLGLLAGVVWFVVMVPPDEMGVLPRAGLMLLGLLPLAATALGFLLTFGGTRVTVDGIAQEVRVTYGRWWPWKREARPFSDFRRVEIVPESTGGVRGAGGSPHAGGTGPDYPVRLHADGDELQLWSGGGYKKARAHAEAVAALLGLPLHDATTPTSSVREAGTLNESIRERARREGERTEWPKLPRGSRVTFEHVADETVIDLPRIRIREHKSDLIGTGVLVLIWAGMAIPGLYKFRGFLDDPHGEPWLRLVQAGALCLPILPAAFLGMGAVVLTTARERVIVSPRVLRREWRWPVGRWTKRMSSDEIEELVIDGDDVLARSDRESLKLGLLLKPADRRWLLKALQHVITTGY